MPNVIKKVQGVVFIFFLMLGTLGLISCDSSSDTVPDDISRVSVDSSGAESDGNSNYSSISSNGRYVAFESQATDLVAGDTNSTTDVFVRDERLGTTIRVSVDSSGVQGDNSSSRPSISPDGRYVAFHSSAENLVANDTNSTTDVFVRDTLNNTTTRVSIHTDDTQGNSYSQNPVISSNGRYVAYHSSATNLVAGDTNNWTDVFVRDTVNNTTTLVSIHTDGTQGNAHSTVSFITPDGRYVGFYSWSSTLVDTDTNGSADIFVRDTQLDTTTLVSIHTDGTQGNDNSYNSSISSDGRYVSFESTATNLVDADTNAYRDIFVRDTVGNTTTRVNVHTDGTVSDGISYMASISSNGRYVAYKSFATNLVDSDTNGKGDIFIRDTVDSATTRVSVDSSGVESDGNAWEATISSDGSYVAFSSDATNLVAGDTNFNADIFRAPNQ